MSDMKKITFDEFVRLNRGFDLPEGKIVDGEYPVVASTNIKAYHNAYKVKPPVVVTGRSGSLGNVQYIDSKCWPLNTSLYSKDFRGNNPKYIYYFLQTMHLEQYNAGAGVPSLNQNHLQRLKIVVHDIDEQKKVSDILSVYDNLIENNNKRIKLLEQMAENLYKEWFVRFRFPGYEDVDFIDGFPKKWEKVKLDDVLNKIATGLNPRKNFVLGEGENFYVTIKNMADNTVYLDDKCDKVNDDAIIKINKRSDLKIGDLLFSGIGTIGRVCLIDTPTNNWNISESVFTMRANKKISSDFLYMLLLSQDVQNYCQSKANGSAQKGIRMGDLRKYTFLLPTKNVINDFTNQISPILSNVSLLRNENKNLIQQRDMLLPRLMSGKLEV